MDKPVAQLVMKLPDGQSILSVEGVTGPMAGSGDLESKRAEMIREKIEKLGFEVTTGNLNTLSITGPAELFRELFGMDVDAALEAKTPAQATKIPGDLEDCVAGVFVTPKPEHFF